MHTNSAQTSRNCKPSKSVENPVDRFCPPFERQRLQSSPSANPPPSKSQTGVTLDQFLSRVMTREQTRDSYGFSPHSAQSEDRPEQQYYRSRDFAAKSSPNAYYSNQSRSGLTRAGKAGPNSPSFSTEMGRADRGADYAQANPSRGGRPRLIPPKILALGDSFIGPLTLFSSEVRVYD